MGDLNARIGDQTAAVHHPQRLVSDHLVDTRGRWLLNFCRMSNLVVLNGTLYEAGSIGAFTSFQPQGQTTIDYILASPPVLSHLSPAAMSVVHMDWSDHDLLALHLAIAHPVQTDSDDDDLSRLIPVDHFRQRTHKSSLDLTVNGLLHLAANPAEMLNHFYGHATAPSNIASWYVAASSDHASQRASFAAVLRPCSPANFAHTTTHANGMDRNILLAISVILKTTPVDCKLVVYTSSQSVIRLICFDAANRAANSWVGANGDVLKRVCVRIQKRTAQLGLYYLNKHRPNEHCKAVFSLARQALHSPFASSFLFHPLEVSLPSRGWSPPIDCPSLRKVLTSLPEFPEPHIPGTHISTHMFSIDDANSHRGRHKERLAQLENLRHLLDAPSLKSWWDLIRTWTDAKPRSVEVTGMQL
ncbi:hypothetical protein C0992_009141, partial [Termitomyces sp. T32_za158]